MKKNYLSLLTIMMAAMLSVGFTSCNNDDDDGGGGGGGGGDIVTTLTGVGDLDMYQKSTFDDFSPAFKIRIDENNCFEGGLNDYSSMEVIGVYFLSVGPVKDISEINIIPEYEQGWTYKTINITPGYGYLVSNRGADFLNKFMRIYVVDYIKGNNGNIIGAKIKYQLLSKQKISVNETTLKFKSEGESKEFSLPYPASYKVENCPSWCYVSEDVNKIVISASKNITPKEYSGQLVLKNNATEITFDIKQEGSSAPQFENGRGTKDDPYQINTASQLQNIIKGQKTDYLNGIRYYYTIISDINMSSYLNASSTGWNPIGTDSNPFTGEIDGQNHTISGMWINLPNTDYVGLFGCAASATIKNIVLKTNNGGILGRIGVGGICGKFSGNISNCSVEGTLSANDDVGGICGSVDSYTEKIQTMPGYTSTYKKASSISNCVTAGVIESSGSNRGKILGFNIDSNYLCYPLNCSSTATLQNK